VLWPLKEMAERLNAAVVLVTHMSKGGAAHARHRVIGSIAWVGACRANFLFVRDAKDPSGRSILMCDNGGNLAAEVPTLSYRIEDAGDGPVVAWADEPVAITADEAIQSQSCIVDAQQTAEARECENWLREMLKDGPVPFKQIQKAAADSGLNLDGVKRAKSRIGATSSRGGFGPGGAWYWTLETTAPGEQ
jgi:putative DNA primase/helicase